MESILSVGIDVGTTTTQVVFSRLFMQNTSGYFNVPRISIVEKQIVYRSKPCFTPLADECHIDAGAVKAILQGEYEKAGIRPADVAAGAVIITGESARKDNAEALVRELSGVAGEFVVSAAGPDMESVIAGKGSGAYAYSQKRHCRVVNLDIGGGTTNAVLFDDGRTVATGCLDVGGRLVRTDAAGVVTGISPAAQRIADANGIDLYVGMRDVGELARLTVAMAALLAQQAGLAPRTPLYAAMATPHSAAFDFSGNADAICFSGGVADAVHGRFSAQDLFRFGDIGILLGRAVRDNEDLRRLPLVPATATISATVIGAGSYTTTVSGSTIAAEAALLPLRDISVYRCTENEQAQLFDGDCEAFAQGVAHAVALNGPRLAIALRGLADPAYSQLKRLAACLVRVADADLGPDAPLIVVCEADMAKVLGQCIRALSARPVISLDGVAAQAQDHLDIGKPVMDGMVVPVVVKTLLFGQ